MAPEVEVVVDVDTQRRRWTGPAIALYDVPAAKLSQIEYIVAADTFSERVAAGIDDIAAARGAVFLMLAEPDYGRQAQIAFVEAVAGFARITIHVVVAPAGVAFSIGDGAMDHLATMLRTIPAGDRVAGAIGTWRDAPSARH